MKWRTKQRQPVKCSVHIKTAEHGLLYYNSVIGTVDADEWAVTFGTVRRSLGGL